MLSVQDKPRSSRAPSLSNVNSSRPAVTWEDYVHVLLMESGQVARAAIHRVKDARHLASTEDLVLDVEQVQALLQGFHDTTALRREGLWLGEDRFTLTRLTDARVLVGRDESTGFGCVIYRCKTCLLVTCYDDGNHPGACYTLVTNLGDFLVENGF
ncbi:uncharacterized protein LOC143294978 [Babylonia areolata]|uniref:uncharacterized protein LOC143294978 n=1 Tax=Babylonia areolata TaxID=304850 RepID=UPI003FD1A7BE